MAATATPPATPTSATPPAAPAAPAAPETKPPAPAPSAPAAPPSDDPFAALEAKAKAPAKPPEQPKPGEEPKKPAPKPEQQFTTPKQLREAHDRATKDLTEARDQIKSLEIKITEAESKGKDTAALSARLAAVEKERDTALAEMRAFKQEASPEFKEKFEKPFNQAAEFASRVIKGLEVVTYDENNEVSGTRQATWEDFTTLYTMPMNKAVKEARKLFGDSAQIVLNHLNELQRLDFLKREALTEEKAKAKEREEADVANQARERDAIADMWRKVNQDISERNPDIYQADPKDTEGQGILNEGYRLVDSALNAGKHMTMQQKILMDANIRNRAASQPYLILLLNRANAKIGELQAQIKETTESAPGDTKHKGGDTPPKAEKGFLDGLEDAMKE